MNKEAFDWNKWGPIFMSGGALAISVLSLAWNILVERMRSRAKLEVLQRINYYYGSEDERTEIVLMFRNLSHRPTAIIDVYIRNKEGGILGGSGYKNNIKLPLQLEPWGIIRTSFRIEENDEKLLADILVKDIEDHEIIIVPHRSKKWVEAK